MDEIEFLKAEGFDDAVLGFIEHDDVYKLVYSKKKCIEILMKNDAMSYDDAIEYFEFNVECAYVGEQTPIWVDDINVINLDTLSFV